MGTVILAMSRVIGVCGVLGKASTWGGAAEPNKLEMTQPPQISDAATQGVSALLTPSPTSLRGLDEVCYKSNR